jgi:hypothetical protein
MSDTEILGSAEQYNVEETFDDIAAPVREAVSKDAQVNALREVVKQAQRSRLPPPAFKIELANGDIGEVSNENDLFDEILGVSGDDSKMFTPVDSPEYPVTQNLYRKFKAAIPATKNVRLDTDASYGRFMDTLRAPFIDELTQRLNELEHSVAAHIDDPEAHHEVLGAAVEDARERASVCGEKIPLSLPPSTKGVSCWQNGENIYCSVRMIGPDGKPRLLTTSTPAARHVEEVISYAEDAGVDPMEVMSAIPAMAQIMGGGALVTQLTKIAPDMLSRPEAKRANGFVAKATPQGDAGVAAVMALLQLCKKGDARACAEAAKLKATSGGAALVASAEKALKLASKGRVA